MFTIPAEMSWAFYIRKVNKVIRSHNFSIRGLHLMWDGFVTEIQEIYNLKSYISRGKIVEVYGILDKE